MNLSTKLFCIGLVVIGVAGRAEAQVKFKLVRQDASTYIVSMVPQKTLSAQQGITGTMQVSLKSRSADGFELGEIKSLQPEVEWDKGSVLKSPDGARDADYLSVALHSIGARGLSYTDGKEVPLFSVRNAGNPAADLQLIDNTSDPLVKAKQNPFNVQNQISVLGLGRINAYSGNLRDETPGTKVGLRLIYPNPATTEVTVEYTNYVAALEGDVVLSIAESGNGRVLSTEKAYMRLGTNRTVMNVGQLAGGHYVVYLQRQGNRMGEGMKLVVAR